MRPGLTCNQFYALIYYDDYCNIVFRVSCPSGMLTIRLCDTSPFVRLPTNVLKFANVMSILIFYPIFIYVVCPCFCLSASFSLSIVKYHFIPFSRYC